MTFRPRLKELVELDSVDSTNTHARRLAEEGCVSGTIVWAHAQTAGRGRHGNLWSSIPGNLFMTMVLRPDKSAAEAAQLSFVAAVALAQTLEEFSPGISLKWPNDALLDGRKVAGILLEAEADGARPVKFVLIGIGVNVKAAPEGAASLASCGVEAGKVLERLVQKTASFYDLWLKEGFAPVRREWLRRSCHDVGNAVKVRLSDKVFSGIFRGIDASGALELDMPDGSFRQVTSGEVFAA